MWPAKKGAQKSTVLLYFKLKCCIDQETVHPNPTSLIVFFLTLVTIMPVNYDIFLLDILAPFLVKQVLLNMQKCLTEI